MLVLFSVIDFSGGQPGAEAPAEAASSVFWLIFFAVVAIGFSFFCSVAEAVLLSVTPSYIATEKEKKKRSAVALEKMKANIDRPLAAILSLNTIAHTVGAAGVGAQAAGIWGPQAVGWASAAMTLLILTLSEIIPKTIGAVYWRVLAAWIARMVQWLIWVLLPLVWLSELMTRMLAGDKQEVVTREEVAAMAELSVAGGELKSDESRIFRNLLQLRELAVQDVMTPRTVIFSFPQDKTVGEVLAEHDHLPVSRIPVYEESLDEVTGFVLKSDILLAQANDQPATQLKELIRPLTTVPETASLSKLFDVLLNNREHIALVLDNYGGTDGLVTLEDVLETLLGAEIVDEADAATDMRRLARKRWKERAEALGLTPPEPKQQVEPNEKPTGEGEAKG